MDNFEQFKKLRNQIRGLNTLSLVVKATQKLRSLESKSIEDWNGFLPWRLLLLIRWGFEYGDYNYPLRNVDEKILVKLVNLVHDFEGAEKNPFLEESNEAGILKFLRTIAFTQFHLQKKFNLWILARQKLLFCNYSPGDQVRQTIEKSLNGLEPIEFLELSYLLWAWFLDNPIKYTFNSSSLFKNLNFPEWKIKSYCSSISLTQKEVKAYLENGKQLVKNPYLQLTETSPLIRYPFLKLNDDLYLIYSQQVFKETISSFYYDIVKSEGGNPIAKLFSIDLEKYIGRGLKTLNIDYYEESELKLAFPNEKVTDYLIPLSDYTLMIEVKSVEMKPIVRVNPNNNSLQQELKDSVIKGTLQGFSVANLIKQNQDKLNIHTRSDFFLMIVTYKDLFLGEGSMVWNEFLRESVQPILSKENISLELIPPNHIVFLSVEEFDEFISIIWQQNATISDVINEILDANKDFKTRKFQFSQHLDRFKKGKMRHPFLDDEYDFFEKDFTNKLLSKYPLEIGSNPKDIVD